MYQLNHVADGAHNQKSHADCLADFDEFSPIGLCTPVQEGGAVFEEVLGDVGHFLECVGHL